METIFEILKIILPTIIAGLFTIFCNKYTNNKNIPLDKLEIAYNRVYYPIYKIISNNDNIDNAVEKSEIYFIKYDKYIDISTKRLFESLNKCNKKTKKRSIYQRFIDNIYNRNSYLRSRLGYLEPSFIQLYRYSMPSTQSFFRIIIEIFFLYISAIFCSISVNIAEKMYYVSLFLFLLLIVIVLVELLWCFIRFIYYKIKE